MEGVGRAGTVGRGIGERLDDLELLDRRAGPAVRDDERQRVLVLRTHVEEVDVDAIDPGDAGAPRSARTCASRTRSPSKWPAPASSRAARPARGPFPSRATWSRGRGDAHRRAPPPRLRSGTGGSPPGRPGRRRPGAAASGTSGRSFPLGCRAAGMPPRRAGRAPRSCTRPSVTPVPSLVRRVRFEWRPRALVNRLFIMSRDGPTGDAEWPCDRSPRDVTRAGRSRAHLGTPGDGSASRRR